MSTEKIENTSHNNEQQKMPVEFIYEGKSYEFELEEYTISKLKEGIIKKLKTANQSIKSTELQIIFKEDPDFVISNEVILKEIITSLKPSDPKIVLQLLVSFDNNHNKNEISNNNNSIYNPESQQNQSDNIVNNNTASNNLEVTFNEFINAENKEFAFLQKQLNYFKKTHSSQQGIAILKTPCSLLGSMGMSTGNFLHQLIFIEGCYCVKSMPKYYADNFIAFSHNANEFRLVIDTLLKLGMDINSLDFPFKQTVLSAAIAWDNTPLAQALIETAGVQINTSCADAWGGTTPLLMAIQRGNTKIAKMLIKSGAYVNAVNTFGMTPLHWAMIMGNAEIIKELLERKEIKVMQNKLGKSPIDYYVVTAEHVQATIQSKEKENYFIPNPNLKEYRPILSHFWDNEKNFLAYRNKHQDNVDECQKLLTEYNKSYVARTKPLHDMLLSKYTILNTSKEQNRTSNSQKQPPSIKEIK